MVGTQVYESALNALPEPVAVIDGAGGCVFANAALRALIGKTDAAPIQRGDFWPSFASKELRLTELTSEFVASSGERFAVKLSQTEIGSGNFLVRVIASSSKDDDAKTFHSQRLETLGLLSGGVAHDFNNILAGILGHTTYLKTILPATGPHVESLGAVEEGAKKASSITQQILSFSKLDTSQRPARLDLAGLVTKTCGLLRGAISPEYNLEFAVPRDAVAVLGIEGKMAQVIINLAINARDAIVSDGKILIAVGESSDPGELARAFHGCELTARRFAVLSVTDNGSGMPPEVVERIFEPYFSTKKDRGTGLGLSTVAAIVREFGGAIVVDSEVGRGTTFAVYLPLLEEERAETTPTRAPSGVLERGHERILIVDDEYPVRNVLSLSLQHLGYSVEVASSGLEALEKYSEPDAFDLVLLDMLMPELSGEETFFKLKALDPNLGVLVISGYSSERSVHNILDNGGRDFLQKPFTIDELSRKVRECLGKGGRGA
ncbi:MAG: hypothetical protein RL417_1216 [Pseudomonadota bacterium]|jgi:signal transduction histidine kinase